MHNRFHSQLSDYIAERIQEFDQVDQSRRGVLKPLTEYARTRIAAGHPARFLFVCTHNSRRSHLAQIWAAVAGIQWQQPVQTWSAGTEVTAFNPRAVAALKRAGFQVTSRTKSSNPEYSVSSGQAREPMVCQSKTYKDQSVPKSDFCAVMTCDSADKACPAVPGADARIPVLYVDPKVSDNTDAEAATYDERCAQIAREMLFAFSEV